jgi:hypothetical protein
MAKSPKKPQPIDLGLVRHTVIVALCSDDVLMERLVLKGGNALALIYRVGGRASVDLDYSIEGDFEDPPAITHRLERAVTAAFARFQLVAFDHNLELRPPLREGMKMHPNWGGYQYTFKLIPEDLHRSLAGNLVQMRAQALPVNPDLKRTFKVDISRFEVCAGKQSHELDDLQLFVYSPAMLAAEKLRAICQQDPEYPLRGHPAPRARDFFDIHTVVEKLGVDPAAGGFASLVRAIFAAKQVPLHYLGRIQEAREFHSADWPSVVETISEAHEDFDYYFEFVLKLVARIPLG